MESSENLLSNGITYHFIIITSGLRFFRPTFYRTNTARRDLLHSSSNVDDFVLDLYFLYIPPAKYCNRKVSYDIIIQVRQFLLSSRQCFPVAAYYFPSTGTCFRPSLGNQGCANDLSVVQHIIVSLEVSILGSPFDLQCNCLYYLCFHVAPLCFHVAAFLILKRPIV